jgi:phosphate uptake regulator
METRKVQRTGKSTFVVSLPKNWALKNGIDSGSILFMAQNHNGALIISADRSGSNLKAKIDIGNKSGDPLIRDIIGFYVAGYKNIEVTSPQMSSAQKRDLHQIVNKLIGPEILEETVNKVLIQDLLSSEELPVERALKRMKSMVVSMIKDSITSLVSHNLDLGHDVMQRDSDVDRLNLLIVRKFAEILRSGSIRNETFNSVTALNYMLAASNLERIADHASSIAEVSSQHGYKLPNEITSELSNLASILESSLDGAIGVLIQADSEKANKLIDNANEIRKRFQIVANSSLIRDKEEILVRLEVAGGIERIQDYIINICELAINLCHADIKA